MPLHGTPNAPKFNSKTPSELPQYLEDIDFLRDSARLNNTKKIKVALHYAALNEAEVWQMLPEASVNLTDWKAFIKAMKKMYPGCKGIEMQRSQQHRSKRENESLVGDSPNYRVMVDSQE